jgi:hypothetical protein
MKVNPALLLLLFCTTVNSAQANAADVVKPSVTVKAEKALSTAPPNGSFDLQFWVSHKSSKDKRIISKVEGLCQPAVTARVTEMPAKSKREALETDNVLELDAEWRIARRWVVPANARPLGVDGDDLLFTNDVDAFRVSVDRQLSKVAQLPKIAEAPEKLCLLPKEFNRAGKPRCFVHTDVTTKKQHQLAYQEPCSK